MEVTELKNTIIEQIYNRGIQQYRLDETEERISELKDRAIQTHPEEKQRMKR